MNSFAFFINFNSLIMWFEALLSSIQGGLPAKVIIPIRSYVNEAHKPLYLLIWSA